MVFLLLGLLGMAVCSVYLIAMLVLEVPTRRWLAARFFGTLLGLLFFGFAFYQGIARW